MNSELFLEANNWRKHTARPRFQSSSSEDSPPKRKCASSTRRPASPKRSSTTLRTRLDRANHKRLATVEGRHRLRLVHQRLCFGVMMISLALSL